MHYDFGENLRAEEEFRDCSVFFSLHSSDRAQKHAHACKKTNNDTQRIAALENVKVHINLCLQNRNKTTLLNDCTLCVTFLHTIIYI